MGKIIINFTKNKKCAKNILIFCVSTLKLCLVLSIRLPCATAYTYISVYVLLVNQSYSFYMLAIAKFNEYICAKQKRNREKQRKRERNRFPFINSEIFYVTDQQKNVLFLENIYLIY